MVGVLDLSNVNQAMEHLQINAEMKIDLIFMRNVMLDHVQDGNMVTGHHVQLDVGMVLEKDLWLVDIRMVQY